MLAFARLLLSSSSVGSSRDGGACVLDLKKTLSVKKGMLCLILVTRTKMMTLVTSRLHPFVRREFASYVFFAAGGRGFFPRPPVLKDSAYSS